MTTSQVALPCEVHGPHAPNATELSPSELANCSWEAHGPHTEEQARASEQAKAFGEAIARRYRDIWDQIATAFRQTSDVRLREAAAVHVGGLKRDYEEAARLSDRTIFEEVRHNIGRALLPRIDDLIASGDADQLRLVMHGMTIGLPNDDFQDDWDEDG